MKNYLIVSICSLSLGFVAGYQIHLIEKRPYKDYPIEVLIHTNRGDIRDYISVDVDSVKGDTIYKDGNMIVNKNIVNVVFK